LSEAAFLAVDWGTTNRRVYVLDADGSVLASCQDDRGVLAMTRDAFPDEVAAMRRRFGDLPVLLAGMAGSTRGWVDVRYLPAPIDLAALAHNLHCIEPGRTAIVPGVSIATGGHGDVIRGEEVQLLGAVTAGLAPADGLLCQPGTHCKWVRMGVGGIERFKTAMTGELFSLLKQHSLLGDFMQDQVETGPAFRDGLDAAADGKILNRLFSGRASALLGRRTEKDTAAYVSGLLIGSDVREQDIAPGEIVFVLADGLLATLYAEALHAIEAEPVIVDSHAAFVAGVTALWRRAFDTHPD
jgi:2-dehydro-3-deoxygalactonokinase